MGSFNKYFVLSAEMKKIIPVALNEMMVVSSYSFILILENAFTIHLHIYYFGFSAGMLIVKWIIKLEKKLMVNS